MPDPRAGVIAAYRQQFPQLKDLSDTDVWRVAAVNDPDLAKSVMTAQEKPTQDNRSAGDVALDQMDKVGTGITNFVSGLPGMAMELGGIAKDSVMGNHMKVTERLGNMGSGMAHSMADPVTPILQQGASELSSSFPPASQEQWEKGAEAAGANLAGMVGGELAGGVVRGARGVRSPAPTGIISRVGGAPARMGEAVGAKAAAATSTDGLMELASKAKDIRAGVRPQSATVPPEIATLAATTAQSAGLPSRLLNTGIRAGAGVADATLTRLAKLRAILDGTPELPVSAPAPTSPTIEPTGLPASLDTQAAEYATNVRPPSQPGVGIEAPGLARQLEPPGPQFEMRQPTPSEGIEMPPALAREVAEPGPQFEMRQPTPASPVDMPNPPQLDPGFQLETKQPISQPPVERRMVVDDRRVAPPMDPDLRALMQEDMLKRAELPVEPIVEQPPPPVERRMAPARRASDSGISDLMRQDMEARAQLPVEPITPPGTIDMPPQAPPPAAPPTPPGKLSPIETQQLQRKISAAGQIGNAQVIQLADKIVAEIPELKSAQPGPSTTRAIKNGFDRAVAKRKAAFDSIPPDTQVSIADLKKGVHSLMNDFSYEANSSAMGQMKKLAEDLGKLGDVVPWDQFSAIKEAYFDHMKLTSKPARDAFQLYRDAVKDLSPALSEANWSYFIAKRAAELHRMDPWTGLPLKPPAIKPPVKPQGGGGSRPIRGGAL